MLKMIRLYVILFLIPALVFIFLGILERYYYKKQLQEYTTIVKKDRSKRKKKV